MEKPKNLNDLVLNVFTYFGNDFKKIFLLDLFSPAKQLNHNYCILIFFNLLKNQLYKTESW